MVALFSFIFVRVLPMGYAYCLLPTVYCLLFTVYCLLFTVHSPLFTVHYSLPLTDRSVQL